MCILSDLEFPKTADIAVLSCWDEAGFPPGPGEDFAQYTARLKAKEESIKALDSELSDKGEAMVFDCLKVYDKERVPAEILQEAAEITQPLYGFSYRYFPGFFLSENVGLLWGGCLVTDVDFPLGVFFIRASFRNRKRFFIYRRQELLAHEMCHAARHELTDWEMDEYFAYQTSPSGLRRYLGNCFIRQRDALLFMLPAMLLMFAQIVQSFWLYRLPVWPFWIAAFGYPAWLLIRNQRSRNRLFRAEKTLKKWGIPEAHKVLFRCTAEERRQLSRIKTRDEFQKFVQEKSRELRWQVILYRFFPDEYKA